MSPSLRANRSKRASDLVRHSSASPFPSASALRPTRSASGALLRAGIASGDQRGNGNRVGVGQMMALRVRRRADQVVRP